MERSILETASYALWNNPYHALKILTLNIPEIRHVQDL